MFVNGSGRNEQEMRNRYRGPSTDASYQISDQLALRFQRRRLKCEKLADDRRRTPSDGKSSHCLWQCELKRVENVSCQGQVILDCKSKNVPVNRDYGFRIVTTCSDISPKPLEGPFLSSLLTSIVAVLEKS